MHDLDNIFDGLHSEEVAPVVNLILKNMNEKSITNNLFWISSSILLNESNIIDSISISTELNNLSSPNNIKLKIKEYLLDFDTNDRIGNHFLFQINKISLREIKVDAAIIPNPALSSLLILSSQLLKSIINLSNGFLILAVNLEISGENHTEVKNNQLFLPEIEVRKRLHDSGFKRIRRMDKLNNSASWKCEKNKIIPNNIEHIESNSVNKFNTKIITTALVCDMGF